jgi:predicted nucleic acid-binding protein
MKAYFADTSLFVAFRNSRDELHGLAVEFVQQETRRLLTTPWVIVELGNFVSKWKSSSTK